MVRLLASRGIAAYPGCGRGVGDADSAGALPWRFVAVRVLVEPDVVAAIGGPAKARAELAGLTPGRFTCVVCQGYGQLGDQPASLILRIFGTVTDKDLPVIAFAHPQCSGSRVERHAELPQDEARVRTVGWVEPPGRDPRAVLLVAPIVRWVSSTPAGDASDLMIANLHAQGYTPVADLVSPLPRMAGLVAYATPAALVVRQSDGHDFYDGTPVGGPEWAEMAAAQGRIRVLFATGLRLDNLDRDPHADLFTAIGRGHVVGAVARYVNGPPRTRPPWRSGRHRHTGGRRR
jgi:hypothetical protein